MNVIDKYFGEHSSAITIETQLDGVKHVFEVRVKFNNRDLELSVNGVGVKKGRERNFKYLSCSDNYKYRALDGVGRNEFERNFFESHVPKEVLNLALDEYASSIKLLKF